MVSHLAKLLATGLFIVAAAKEQKVLQDEAAPPKNATLKLFPIKSTEDALRDGCPSNELGETLSLATETCLSGDYTLLNNIRVTEDPTCEDGRKATLAVYDHRGCTYPATYDTAKWDVEIPRDCLKPTETRYWSLIFRCGPWGALKDGADAGSMAAAPPGREMKSGEPISGLIKTHFMFDCGGTTIGGNKAIELPVDRCMTSYSNAIQILREPVCANGTRAQWARFTDRKCTKGEITVEDGLVDIEDADIGGRCLSSYEIGWGEERTEMQSMAFWCDGFGERV